MKKTGLYFFIIALMLLLVNLLNFGVAPKDKVIMAYYGAPGTQGLVNTFDTIYLAGEPTPPSGRDLDVWKWASQSVSPTPTPQMSDYGPFALLDTNGPIGGNGNSFARVSWIAQAQYISLEQRYFENVGGPAGVSTESQDWRLSLIHI